LNIRKIDRLCNLLKSFNSNTPLRFFLTGLIVLKITYSKITSQNYTNNLFFSFHVKNKVPVREFLLKIDMIWLLRKISFWRIEPWRWICCYRLECSEIPSWPVSGGIFGTLSMSCPYEHSLMLLRIRQYSTEHSLVKSLLYIVFGSSLEHLLLLVRGCIWCLEHWTSEC